MVSLTGRTVQVKTPDIPPFAGGNTRKLVMKL